MTPRTDGLEAIIARLEAATGPDCKLDGEIFKLLNPEGHWVEFSGVWHRRDDVDFVAYDIPPKFSLSIDAALTLVPEGWRIGFEDAGRCDHNDLVEAWCWPFESEFEPEWQNGDQGYRSAEDSCRAAHQSRTIAIVIASLKARAVSP